MPRPLVAVVGGHRRNTNMQAETFAERMGAALHHAGYGIICGGGDGIMEAACRGHKRAGGLTVGVLKSNRPAEANSHVDVAVCTSMDVASNNVIIWSACAVLAFEGRYGTLNEVALALDFGKPLLVLGPSALLTVASVDAPLFRHFPDYDPAGIPRILQEMRSMIAQSAPSAAPTRAAGA
jgi:uncharacterized protein (TIGR00725 family)